MDYKKLMSEARQFNAKMNKADEQAGFKTPGESPLSSHVQAAMMAIQCGIKTNNWDAVAQGQAILEDVIERMK